MLFFVCHLQDNICSEQKTTILLQQLKQPDNGDHADCLNLHSFIQAFNTITQTSIL